MDPYFHGNDSNSRFSNMSYLRKQESRKFKSIVTMKYKEDADCSCKGINTNPVSTAMTIED